MFQIALIGIGLMVILFVLISLADSLIQIEAKKSGINTENTNMSLWPSFTGSSASKYAEKGKFHKLLKGHDIKLAGKPVGNIQVSSASRFSVRPPNFRGIAPIPKMLVEVGAEVKAGDPVFFDKQNEEVRFVAPVSGEIVNITRGEKRSIVDVVVLADKTQSYRSYQIPSLTNIERSSLIEFLIGSGIWPAIIQRPFGVLASRTEVPRDIFVSGFNTAPLAVDTRLTLDGRMNDLNKGLEVLSKLTSGKVYFSCQPSQSDITQQINHAEIHYFDGPHPAGNVGVQIHHIKSIKGADMVWTMGLDDVLTLGRLFNDGKYVPTRIVALGGKIADPKFVSTIEGANIGELLEGQIQTDNLRIIAGDILTGQAVGVDNYLNKQDTQISVIKEGDYYEPFGWLLPLKLRPSVSRTFPNFLFKNYEFDVDTNTHGEKRAFVMTGQYEKMLPMDIYPQHLMKAILTGNIEKMEGLGINELLEEDVALAEFSCTSKQPLQAILRDGLEMMNEQV